MRVGKLIDSQKFTIKLQKVISNQNKLAASHFNKQLSQSNIGTLNGISG
jgi:hypothetical protein